MISEKSKASKNFVKAVHPARPDWAYFLPEPDKEIMEKLGKRPLFPETCDRPCTRVMTLFPKRKVEGHSGYGYYMVNVNGFRVINAYVISEALNSTTQRGFTLEISFSVNDFEYGVGVIGETSYFYNFEHFFNPGTFRQQVLRCETSDLTTTGGVPWIGGTDLTHILRVPVMGPFLRASVFNEDSVAREVEVRAYLST